MKSEHRLERNRLKGTLGNAINALLSAAAMNFGKLIKWVGQFWLFFCALLKIFRPLLPHCRKPRAFSASTPLEWWVNFCPHLNNACREHLLPGSWVEQA
jgi:hypothetical protein